MSLGALAAAATLAAAAVPSSSPTHAAAYSLAHMPHNFPLLPPPARDDHPNLHTPPAMSPRPQLIPQPIPNTLSYSASHHVDPHQLPPVLNQIPNPHMPQQKPSNAKPVAPAPNSAMHPSQIPSVPTHPNGKPKQRRYRASPEQLRQLIARFEINPSPTSAELQELAAKITMPAQSVILWFKNRRARVPHKMAQKALNAKRRENGLGGDAGISKPSKPSNGTKKQSPSTNARSPQPTVKRSSSFTVEAAAASLAEMAMPLAPTKKPPEKAPANQAGRNTTSKQGAARSRRAESFVVRSPSMSPPPPYRPKAENVVPYDTLLVKKLGSNASNRGAEFVQASPTPRRPRTIPPTPRVFSQNAYEKGDKVEVLETEKGICRAWYSATIVGPSGPRELSLGASAAVACGLFPSGTGAKTSNTKQMDGMESEAVGDDGSGDGGDSPRTVRSPAASPTPPIAKVVYKVRFDHRFEEVDENKLLEAEVGASRIRPAAPFMSEESPMEWRPLVGEAVEVLKNGTWFVAVTQNFVLRKGYMVSFESGDVEWVRRPRLRPYQIWRGGQRWVTKTKAPLAVVRKGVGLSVTIPPGGKRKRSSSDLGSSSGSDGRETRARTKRSRSVNVQGGSGPDGLPEGWRVDYSIYRVAAGSKAIPCYVAPDGSRLRSLKEAQRYVSMMGPA